MSRWTGPPGTLGEEVGGTVVVVGFSAQQKNLRPQQFFLRDCPFNRCHLRCALLAHGKNARKSVPQLWRGVWCFFDEVEKTPNPTIKRRPRLSLPLQIFGLQPPRTPRTPRGAILSMCVLVDSHHLQLDRTRKSARIVPCSLCASVSPW